MLSTPRLFLLSWRLNLEWKRLNEDVSLGGYTMKKLLLISFAALCGCTATVSNDDADEPQTFSDLPKCTNSNKGQMVYLPEDDTRYLCEDKEWKLLGVISSSSKQEDKSSDSQRPSSSSSEESKKSSSSESEKDCDNGYVCDSRDGQKYKTTVIGKQTWMAENLNFKVDDSYCYDLANAYCEKYGRLYTRNGVMNTKDNNLIVKDPYQGICPDGWHVPSYDEFFTLMTYVDENNGDEGVGKSLKSSEWDEKSSDAFGFAALGAGRHWSIGFDYKDEEAAFWSSVRDSTNGNNNYWRIRRDGFDADWEFSDVAYSLRCIKD